MSTIVKICGLSTPETLDAALDAGADMVGFVFFQPSPRNITLEQGRALGRQARGRAIRAALTVDAEDALLASIVEALEPDLLQLHGRETPERTAAVKARFGIPVMKALPVESAADLAAPARYAAAADRLLFDARAPRGATRPGGLGRPFDWTVLQGFASPLPYLLSGGLDADNVAEALRVTRAPGVDVSSGVEQAPGVKDPDKIRAFIAAARAAERALAAPKKTGTA